MLGPYQADKDKTVSYRGNKLFSPVKDISSFLVPVKELESRVKQLHDEKMWSKIAKINHQINLSTNQYFHKIGALFTPLPLITRMISSPGAIYNKNIIKYTTDTCPITLKWFNLHKKAFLSESSQIYLELALTQKGINQVYSIYNSFRKEKADANHLSEFHHIEYEGKVTQKENEKIALGLVGKLIGDLLRENEKELVFFLSNKKLKELENLTNNIQRIPKITFREALDSLYSETKEEKYKNFTTQDNFRVWEEVKLTEIYNNMLVIKEFPLLEVPFYHAKVDMKKPEVADNADIIWSGYREYIGSGHRVRSKKELEEKAKIFNLPKEDYNSYLKTRKFKDYKETSGFGLGWERMLQGLLEMPFIWSAAQFPRIDKTLKP